MLLHSKEEQTTTIIIGLQEIEPVYNKRQDAIIFNGGNN